MVDPRLPAVAQDGVGDSLGEHVAGQLFLVPGQVYFLGALQFPERHRDAVGPHQDVNDAVLYAVFWIQVGLRVVAQRGQEWLDDLEAHDGLVGGGRGRVQVIGVAQAILPEAGKNLADGGDGIHHGSSTRRLSKCTSTPGSKNVPAYRPTSPRG